MSYNKETGMYEGYIYKIYNDVNDKIYIGQTRENIKERFRRHISDSLNNRDDGMALHAAIRKYGKEYFHIVEVEKTYCDSMQELIIHLNEKEIFYIDSLKSISPNGYNVSIGGVTNDIKRVPVIRYDTITSKFFEYESIIEASRQTGIKHSCIMACCSGTYFSTHRNIFRYKSIGISDEDINYYIHLHPKVKKYDYHGNLLAVYLSPKNALPDLIDSFPSVSGTSISACCMGKLKTAYGFVWRYEYDSFDKYDVNDLFTKSHIKAKTNKS